MYNICYKFRPGQTNHSSCMCACTNKIYTYGSYLLCCVWLWLHCQLLHLYNRSFMPDMLTYLSYVDVTTSVYIPYSTYRACSLLVPATCPYKLNQIHVVSDRVLAYKIVHAFYRLTNCTCLLVHVNDVQHLMKHLRTTHTDIIVT